MGKRLNLEISDAANAVLQDLCGRAEVTMTQAVKHGLLLFRIYLDETAQGNHIRVVSSKGEIKEIVLPIIQRKQS